ncbi:hypothetical protein, partial [Candidatus Thiosymbion oneisti]|uniref:hypothetical protein n=1 Tax=Candidatus Thiosymbion oneisti TaxID=589554 RepID=UPI001C40451A
DHGRVPPDVLECGGNLTPMLTGTYSARHKRGAAKWHHPAAALDLAKGVAARGKRRRRGAGGT